MTTLRPGSVFTETMLLLLLLQLVRPASLVRSLLFVAVVVQVTVTPRGAASLAWLLLAPGVPLLVGSVLLSWLVLWWRVLLLLRAMEGVVLTPRPNLVVPDLESLP